jgi:hypothetical protein
MSEILDPTNSDWDYARLLLHDAECKVFKMKGPDSFIPDAKTFFGKLDAPAGKEKHLRPGEMAFFSNQDGIMSISDVESIEPKDAIERIILKSKGGSYFAIEQIDEKKRHRKSSLHYLRRGYLGFDDFMYDGFYDGGKSLKFCIDKVPGTNHPITGLRFRECKREVIVYDVKEDPKLAEQLEYVKKLIDPVEDIRIKIRLLAEYVAQTMGDLDPEFRKPKAKVRMCEENIRKIRTLNPTYKIPVIMIGDLEYGVCRHRAGKFKYFGDRLGIQGYLLRGKYGDEDFGQGHAWNTVRIENEDGPPSYYFKDVMHDPSALCEGSHPASGNYHREGKAGRSLYKGSVGLLSVAEEAEREREYYDRIINGD